jgi:hypothetical protein
MSAPKTAIELTFKGLLAFYLWREFPDDSTDDIELRAVRLIQSCTPGNVREESAWRATLADYSRQRNRGSA